MASGRAIDHVVLTVRDLDAAAITYQRLGFTLTPRAAHDDQMGTSNRLAQFRGRNFIELLEVDRPETLARHEFATRRTLPGLPSRVQRYLRAGLIRYSARIGDSAGV